MPDVPTIAEAGVPGYEATIWLGLMAPKNTPPPIVARLNAEVAKIVGHPETARPGRRRARRPMAMSIAEFTRYLNDDIAKWAHIVKVSGRQGRAVTSLRVPRRAAMAGELNLLCAGAVKGLVLAVQARFERATGVACAADLRRRRRDARRAARGRAVRRAASSPTAMIAALQASGELRAASRRAIGRVADRRSRCRRRRRCPTIDSARVARRRRCSAASAIYFPDASCRPPAPTSPRSSTARPSATRSRRACACSPTARRRCARSPTPATARIGCTQATEIRYTPRPRAGRRAAGAVRSGHRLQRRRRRAARHAERARRFIELLAGPTSADAAPRRRLRCRLAAATRQP